MNKQVLAVRHVPHEGLGTVADALANLGLRVEIVDAPTDADRPFAPEDWAGLVVLGGPMNVDETDRYPFLAREVEWIQAALRHPLPVMGICLGSQLLAKALGARVYPNSVKEIGWYPLELTNAAANDRLFGQLAPQEVVFQWHGDTFDLPEGAVHLANSPLCLHQAFRYGSSAYGLQFHVEVTADIIDDWLGEEGNCTELRGLDYINPQVIRRETSQRLSRLREIDAQVLGQFAALCREHADRG